MAEVEVEASSAVNANKSEEEEVYSSCEDEVAGEENEVGQDEQGEGEAEAEVEGDGEGEGEGEGEAEVEVEGDVANKEKPLDDDQDRRNPQYIPKGGAFYEHDNRTSLEDVENEDPQETEKKKKVWKESKASERWLHDCYDEHEQTPKSEQEIIDTYGYDIRHEEAAPKARRRRKYGRGPDKYQRSWEDTEAYFAKQSTPRGRGGRRRNFGKEEFPPLPNQKNEARGEKPTPVKEQERSSPWKNNTETSPKSKPPSFREHERPPPQQPQINHHSNLPGFHSKAEQGFNRRPNNQNFNNRRIIENDTRPFKNDGGKFRNNMRPGKFDDIARPIKTTPIRHTDPPFPRNPEHNRNPPRESDIGQITEGFRHMTFHNKNLRHKGVDNKLHSNEQIVDDNKILESELDNPANRQNPKRYSKIRKGFTGFFPPEEITEIDPNDLKQLQQQQQEIQQQKQQQQQQQQQQQHVSMGQPPMNMQNVNVMRRYANSYNGNAGYIPARPIISGIQQQGIAPQNIQALSPQGIPQQALSPQVPGLQTIELQTTPLPPQPNFVPPPMFIEMDSHYTPEVLGPYTSYPPPYSGSQTGEVYQTPSGITYYSTECQSTGQIRPPPARRPKAAIPIVPPPE